MADKTVGYESGFAAFARTILAVAASIAVGEPLAGSAAEAESVYEAPADVQVAEPKLTPRPEPLRDFPVERVLNVTDFGGVPNDDENDVAGIRPQLPARTDGPAPLLQDDIFGGRRRTKRHAPTIGGEQVNLVQIV